MTFIKLKNPSPWRKLALVTWKSPGDPSVYAPIEFDATNALAYLNQLNQTATTKITMTHLIAKASGMVIEKYPSVNGIIKWGAIYQRQDVSISLQVAVPNHDSPLRDHLSLTKIENISQKSLPDIAQELSQSSGKIRQGEDKLFQKTFGIAKFLPSFLLKVLVKIHAFLVYNLNLSIPSLGIIPDPFGSAMVTSVGSLGVPPGFAPLVPPSRCPFLICLGMTKDKAWVLENKEIAVRPITTFVCTFDHRFLDGFMASRMFKSLMEILDQPQKFL